MESPSEDAGTSMENNTIKEEDEEEQEEDKETEVRIGELQRFSSSHQQTQSLWEKVC